MGRAPTPGFLESLLARLLLLPELHPLRRWFEFDGQLVCAPRALIARLLVAMTARGSRLLAQWVPRFGYFLREESQWQHHCALLLPESMTEVALTDPGLPMKHAVYLRGQFQLVPALQQQVADYLAPLRRRYQRVFGLHIRRGDYQVYRDGQWFFDFPTYRQFASHVTAQFPGEKIGWVVATQGTFPAEEFAGIDVHPGPGHLALDMYALAGCDLILGPLVRSPVGPASSATRRSI